MSTVSLKFSPLIFLVGNLHSQNKTISGTINNLECSISDEFFRHDHKQTDQETSRPSDKSVMNILDGQFCQESKKSAVTS